MKTDNNCKTIELSITQLMDAICLRDKKPYTYITVPNLLTRDELFIITEFGRQCGLQLEYSDSIWFHIFSIVDEAKFVMNGVLKYNLQDYNNLPSFFETDSLRSTP